MLSSFTIKLNKQEKVELSFIFYDKDYLISLVEKIEF